MAIAIVIALSSCSLSRAHAQPATDEPAAGAADEEVQEHRGLVILRISEEWLDRTLATDIDTRTRVDRCVLQTRAIGTAHTEGHADVDPKPDQDDATFRVVVTGTSNSRTVGRNGPAIITSRSATDWKVAKIVRFDAGKFMTEPGVIESHTRLIPVGVDASVPGLRGMLTRGIARRRVQQSRATAERITERDTRQRVLAEVDESIDGRIAKLNAKIASRPILERILPLLDTQAARLYTSRHCIHLAFLGVDAVAGVVCPLDELEPSETELWIHASLLGLPVIDLPEPADQAMAWFNNQLSGLDLPELDLPEVPMPDVPALEILPMDIQVVGQWIVLRSQDAEADTETAKTGAE
ncbi:MAG: hypothetical protein DWQ37_11545 [Planctomycetota bacterium]|nr:MAG: hypothetical protein DWQ37_11545 [Planctomycetota bacterium]